ncbi:MAG: hypothetical protein L6428_05425 [Candidatus Aminicenantes bacterium]|nr:hypothetical protein [Candidatus Aminicenantes bacterium]
MILQRLNWNQRNFDALNEFLAGVRPGELAVFDWDNTCIFGDIGEAVFRHQALHLEFKFNPGLSRKIFKGHPSHPSRCLTSLFEPPVGGLVQFPQ